MVPCVLIYALIYGIAIVKIRQAGKNPQEVQKELSEFFTKRGFEYEVHVGYLYQEEITREKAQQIADGLNADWRNWCVIFMFMMWRGRFLCWKMETKNVYSVVEC